MTGFVMVFHGLISLLLVVVILMQSGRGGGLTGGFASAESMFGAQTNEFMIKATTVIAALFLATSLGLAILSSQKGKSLMPSNVASESPQEYPAQPIDTVAVGEQEERPSIPPAAEVEKPDISPEAETKLPAVTPTDAQLDSLPGDAPVPVIKESQ